MKHSKLSLINGYAKESEDQTEEMCHVPKEKHSKNNHIQKKDTAKVEKTHAEKDHDRKKKH